MMRVLLSVDRHDGNDPIEVEAGLPIVPRKGDSLAFWDKPQAGFYNGGEVFADVDCVVISVCEPDRIVVCLRFESFDIEQVERVMQNVQEGVTP